MTGQLEIVLKVFAIALPKVLLTDDFLKSLPGDHHAEVRALTQELFRDKPTVLLDMVTTNLPAVQTTERYQFHKDQNNVRQRTEENDKARGTEWYGQKKIRKKKGAHNKAPSMVHNFFAFFKRKGRGPNGPAPGWV